MSGTAGRPAPDTPPPPREVKGWARLGDVLGTVLRDAGWGRDADEDHAELPERNDDRTEGR